MGIMEDQNNPSIPSLIGPFMLTTATMMQATDIRELSFQNVVDQILKPNNVKVGGIPDNIFLDMTENEKESLICNICFLIVNDARQCKNEHLFCQTCIFAWSLTYGENSQKCPMCRADQTDYEENKKVNKLLQDKRVACPEDACTFKAPLKVFLMHGHGKTKYSNSHVDFESIKPPTRPGGARLLVLPNLTITGNNRLERAHSIRNQLHQGRMMIHQMMLLLHLEMQLRQQAVTSFQEATDPYTRLSRLDEVMALNEQLNEVGSVLSTLLNSPMNNMIAANRALQESEPGRPSLGTLLAATGDSTSLDGADDDDSSDSSDDDSSIVTRLRREAVSRRALTTNQNSSSTQANNVGSTTYNSDRSLRRSEIRQSLQASRSERNTDTSSPVPVISQGRNLPDNAQASMPTTDLHPRVLIGRSQVSNRAITRPSGPSSGQNVTLETTRRLGSASGSRSIQTTVNSRNQTLPSVPAANIVTPRNQISDTPRPPSSQPSEAGLPDEERPAVPNGSSAYNRVRTSLQNSTSDSNSNSQPMRRSESNGNHNRGTSFSWHSGSNTGSTPRANGVARQQPNSVARSSVNNNPSNLRDNQRNSNQSVDTSSTATVETHRAAPADVNANSSSTSQQRVPSATVRRTTNRSQESSNTIDTSGHRAVRVMAPRNRTGSIERSQRISDTLQNTNNNQRPSVTTRRRSTSINNTNRHLTTMQTNGSSPTSNLSQSVRQTRPKPPQQPKTSSNSTHQGRTGGMQRVANTTTQAPLLRARRRSEIRQDLMKERSNNNNS